MKKIPMLATMALMLMVGCSKDTLADAGQDYVQLEESSKIDLKGKGNNFSGNGYDFISFYSNSTVNGNFVMNGLETESNGLPTVAYLLRQGTFSGSITGYGKIKSSLSTYEFSSCVRSATDLTPECSVGEPWMFEVVAEGTLALGTRDYCSITITGNIYPWYYPEFGYYGGILGGTATTHSGAGKLKGLDNKSFSVYSGAPNGPTINLETGTITLRINDYEQMQGISGLQ